MIKQCTVVALLAISTLVSTLAGAAREEHTFEVSLTVPSRAFYILPVEPGWIHQPQRLNWDYPTSNLSSVRKYFDVRHESSAIRASLELPAYLSNGRPGDEIPLRVRFNGVELRTSEATEVVSRYDASVGARVLLEIDPLKPAGGYQPGDYSGNVLLMFNAQSPGA